MKYQFFCKVNGIYTEGPACGSIVKAVRGLKRLVKAKDDLEFELTRDDGIELTDVEQNTAKEALKLDFEKIKWSKIKEF